MVEFWPFFRPSVLFPHTQNVGLKPRPFKDEAEYLEFLKNDTESAKLWMDHHDMQAVANMYQISIHILTTNIRGKEDAFARWTHLTPDSRLKSFSKDQPQLPDMWLYHTDDSHFNLIVRKDSVLAKEGSIHERRDVTENGAKANHKDEENEANETETEGLAN